MSRQTPNETWARLSVFYDGTANLLSPEDFGGWKCNKALSKCPFNFLSSLLGFTAPSLLTRDVSYEYFNDCSSRTVTPVSVFVDVECTSLPSVFCRTMRVLVERFSCLLKVECSWMVYIQACWEVNRPRQKCFMYNDYSLNIDMKYFSFLKAYKMYLIPFKYLWVKKKTNYLPD